MDLQVREMHHVVPSGISTFIAAIVPCEQWSKIMPAPKNQSETLTTVEAVLNQPIKRTSALVDTEHGYLIALVPLNLDAEGNFGPAGAKDKDTGEFIPSKTGKVRPAITAGFGEPAGVIEVNGVPRVLNVSLKSWA
jgi:hypothetical protein